MQQRSRSEAQHTPGLALELLLMPSPPELSVAGGALELVLVGDGNVVPDRVPVVVLFVDLSAAATPPEPEGISMILLLPGLKFVGAMEIWLLARSQTTYALWRKESLPVLRGLTPKTQ